MYILHNCSQVGPGASLVYDYGHDLLTVLSLGPLLIAFPSIMLFVFITCSGHYSITVSSECWANVIGLHCVYTCSCHVTVTCYLFTSHLVHYNNYRIFKAWASLPQCGCIPPEQDSRLRPCHGPLPWHLWARHENQARAQEGGVASPRGSVPSQHEVTRGARALLQPTEESVRQPQRLVVHVQSCM